MILFVVELVACDDDDVVAALIVNDGVEVIERVVVVVGSGAHLLGLLQSHGSEQLAKQF